MNIYQNRLVDIEENIDQLKKEREQAIIDLNKHDKKYFNELKKKNDLIRLMIENDYHIVSGEFIKPTLVSKSGVFIKYITVPEFISLTKEEFIKKTIKKIL